MMNATSRDLYLYTCDSKLLDSGTDVQNIEIKLRNELGNEKNWFEENKLPLHWEKLRVFYLLQRRG